RAPDGVARIIMKGRVLIQSFGCRSLRPNCYSSVTSSLRTNGSRECAPDDRLRDPYRVVPLIETRWPTPFAKLRPVVMGPCLPPSLKLRRVQPDNPGEASA